MPIKNIKIYLADTSSLEDTYLEGSFKITCDENGKALSVTDQNKKLLLVGRDCEIYFE